MKDGKLGVVKPDLLILILNLAIPCIMAEFYHLYPLTSLKRDETSNFAQLGFCLRFDTEWLLRDGPVGYFLWPSRAVMVRATFKIRVYNLALNPNLSMANSNNF
jgi:hypothetical protein